MLFIVGFLFMVFIFAVVSMFSGVSTLFIDLPSASMILVPLLFFFFASKSGKILGKYVKTSFRKEHKYSETELAAFSAAVKNTVKFILVIGVFCFVEGVIVCMTYLDSRDKLGPNLAITLITLMYSIAVSCFVFFPAQVWAENKINILKDEA